ncbi:unnamed protein product [Nezara viridula]|uniref:Uncharacterized protein n=1 Tax=Nezara viridula TaxID=85310 RepID=A0A9P0H134_NEZVI|nr:unnamed protein product [Nezara viridula]
MRISNAFHTYELVFVFLINYLKISTAWGKGRYFSDYEYPEIQLLFSSKEETNAERDSKTGNIRTVQDNAGFSPAVDSDGNSFLEASERHKIPNEHMLKPWMRKPYAEEINHEKITNDKNKERNSEEYKFKEEKHTIKSNQFKNTPIGDVEKRQFWLNEDKNRKILSSYINSRRESNSESGNIVRPRKTKYHKRVNFLNHNRISPFRGDSNKRYKNQVVKASHENDADTLNDEKSDNGNDLEMKLGTNPASTNLNEKIFSGSRVIPEYEENVQEYDELTGMLSKNEAMAAKNLLSNPSAAGQTKEELTGSTKLNYETPGVVNEHNEVTNVKSIVTNQPIKYESTQGNITNGNQGVVSNEITFINRVPSLLTETSRLYIGMPPSTITNHPLSSIQETNSKLNASQANGNGMIVRQFNRVVQENHPLLAKPPVKIAGTLMDKHSEDDNEVILEEKDNKMVKVAQINTKIISSTDLNPVGVSVGLQNNVPSNAQVQETSKTVLFNENYDPSPKKKRNINEKKTANARELLKEKSPTNILENKLAEKKSGLESIDSLIDLDNDESYETKKNKFIKPGYYSLTKSNTALGMVNNLMTKLRPSPFVKKKKMREEKYNESYKRNVPLTYEVGVDSGYDYYRSKDGQQGDPIRAYYDYENDYDLDYKDSDYPRVSHLNHTALAAEKELYDYDAKSFSNNFPRNKNKSKRNKYRKVEESYGDIFAHPISLDDPELQILRDDDDELVKRRMHHNNFATRHREKSEGKEFSQFQNGKTAEVESMPRSHLKKNKMEQGLHARHNKVQTSKKQAMGDNEVSDKKNH